MADLGGAPDAHPPTDQNFFNFIGFSENIIKILGRHPPRDWRPLLGEVLAPPLLLIILHGGSPFFFILDNFYFKETLDASVTKHLDRFKGAPMVFEEN